jgi:AraC family transcriptional regulator, transcriptional activator of pobA
MSKPETIEDFYRQKCDWLPDTMQKDIGHFNVFKAEGNKKSNSAQPKYARRDFYKVSLSRGSGILHYADKSIEISGSTLLFFNPYVPYTFESLSPEYNGYFCIFKDAFFDANIRRNLSELPMFMPGGKPAYVLNKEQDKTISEIYEKMLQEINSDYTFKFDLIRNYLTEVIHQAMKLQPSDTHYQHPNANSRITAVFTDLLERQFPIESPSQQFKLRSAGDFAKQLSVHVNHLNRAIRETTGKTTTEHIAERLVGEAKALLRHTSWNVSEIAYCLGFEEPAHFNNFFKKQTSMAPTAFRS